MYTERLNLSVSAGSHDCGQIPRRFKLAVATCVYPHCLFPWWKAVLRSKGPNTVQYCYLHLLLKTLFTSITISICLLSNSQNGPDGFF